MEGNLSFSYLKGAKWGKWTVRHTRFPERTQKGANPKVRALFAMAEREIPPKSHSPLQGPTRVGMAIGVESLEERNIMVSLRVYDVSMASIDTLER